MDGDTPGLALAAQGLYLCRVTKLVANQVVHSTGDWLLLAAT